MDGKRTQQEQGQKESKSGADCIFQVGRFSIYRRQLPDKDVFTLECTGKKLFESESLYDVYQQCVLRHCQEKFYVTRRGDKWVVTNSVQVVDKFTTHKAAMAVATALNIVEAKRRVQDV